MSYIVPRDTPKTCSGCIFSRWSQIYEGKYWCVLNESDEAIYVELHQKSFNCPLIEIPTPHGRLIEADKLWDRMYKYTDNEGAKMPFGDNDFMIHRDSACELIEDAPTVIEAEWSEK